MRTIADFARRFRSRELLVGTFVKTPDPVVIEVLARSLLDFVVLDAEHAPFDRRDINDCVLAAREGGLPVLVRVPSSDPVGIQQALDVAAQGVVVPHIRTPGEAAAVVRSAHFGNQGRGYAGSTRAAEYTKRSTAMHMELSAQSTLIIAQIEDAEALPHAQAIANTEGIDGIFIGPVDLSISMGESSPGTPEVLKAMQSVAGAVESVGKASGIFIASADDLDRYAGMSLCFLLVRSEQSFMMTGADLACTEIRSRL